MEQLLDSTYIHAFSQPFRAAEPAGLIDFVASKVINVNNFRAVICLLSNCMN